MENLIANDVKTVDLMSTSKNFFCKYLNTEDLQKRVSLYNVCEAANNGLITFPALRKELEKYFDWVKKSKAWLMLNKEDKKENDNSTSGSKPRKREIIGRFMTVTEYERMQVYSQAKKEYKLLLHPFHLGILIERKLIDLER